MNLSHRIALDPTEKQIAYFRQACGTRRFVWNLALDAWESQFKLAADAAKAARSALRPRAKKAEIKRAVSNAVEVAGGWPSGVVLKKIFNEFKYEAFPWLEEVHRDAHSQPFSDLHDAYVRYKKGLAEKPRYKKRGQRDSFYVANDKFEIKGKKIRLPVAGWVRLRESLRFTGKIISATVSRTADKWFVSVSVETDASSSLRQSLQSTQRRPVIGVDLGVRHAAVTSTGSVHDGPKPLKKALRTLARFQRSQSRKLVSQKADGREKRSGKWRRGRSRVARLHARVARVRLDFLHKLTTDLCRKNQAVVIEDLNVKGMLRNRRLSRAISDVGWGEFRRQLGYKSEIYGTRLVVVSRWLPSSKTCSRCGVVGPGLPLSQRTFQCAACGLELDRDLNAALNLEHEYPRLEGNQRPRTGRIGASSRDDAQPSLVEAGTRARSVVGAS